MTSDMQPSPWTGTAMKHLPAPRRRRPFLLSITISALLLFLFVYAHPPPPAWPPLRRHHPGSATTLANFALQKVLADSTPIFGAPSASKDPPTATWMKSYHDATLLVHMNLPGTHDAATWNYSRSTQSSLHYISGLAKLHPSNAANYRCQTRSLADMLAAGIRVFDLRYAFDVTRTALVFWHGNALQSETATVDDVLFSFYAWLQSHPSEAIFLSFQHEGGKNDAETQWLLHAALQSPAARQFVSQDRGRLTTLGEARGQITLLRRFDLDQLDPSYERSMPGLHFPPSKWTVNGANISLTYNESTGETAYIQDYYNPVTPHGSNASMNIRWKLNATEAHMRRAATSNHGSLFWHFASSTKTSNDPPDTPVIQALGNGSLTPDGGVNQQLIGFMQEMRGKRLGITMFDFYDEPEELLSTYLSLLSPEQARDMSREVEHGSCIYCLM